MKEKDLPIFLKPEHAFHLIGVSKSKGWELLSRGELKRVKIGRSTRIPAKSLIAFVNRKMAEGEG